MDTQTFIAVGYDGSPDSSAALSWAADLAARRHEQVVATIVVDPQESPRGIAWPEFWWKEIEDQARAVLAPFPDVEYRLVRRTGNKVASLVEAGDGASMTVVGSHGHSVVGEVFLGSVSQSVARHATSPVVVVREPRTIGSGRIVVGFDGSGLSKRALDFAFRMAELTGDKVVAVRARQETPVAMDRDGYAPPPFRTGSLDEQEAALRFEVEELRLGHPTVGIDSDLVCASPGHALVDASSSASLVVVGSHGQSAVVEALIGTVAHDVLHKAHCPVAVVK
jgi:nucleotide-binding universal stress UspA family protein